MVALFLLGRSTMQLQHTQRIHVPTEYTKRLTIKSIQVAG